LRVRSNTRGAASRGVAKKFNALDFHDDNLLSARILPGRLRQSAATVELRIEADHTGKIKALQFLGCANCRWNLDFDVLADNGRVGNVRGSQAGVDLETARQFVESMRRHWRTTYVPSSRRNHPIRRKLKELRGYTLFRLRFFGGMAEILARSYTLKRPRKGVK
jgi:hypothetical protein